MNHEADEQRLKSFVTKALRLKNQVFIGIDPGASGAIGLLCGSLAEVIDIPSVAVSRQRRTTEAQQAATGKKTKAGKVRKFDHAAICRLFRILKPLRQRTTIAVEIAQVQIGGRHQSNNSFTAYRVGIGYGMWPLFLMACGYAVQELTPSVWKRKMQLSKDKDAVRIAASTLWPFLPLSAKAHHNRAEAIFLAEYARRCRGRM